MSTRLAQQAFAIAALVAGAACTSATLQTADPGATPPSADAGDDGGSSGGEAGTDSALPPSSTDGTPSRVACTSDFGTALTLDHGRLDGFLVAIVPTNEHACNGDPSHVHLQLSANGGVYDVAVNLDTLEADIDVALPGGAWSEGWHGATRLDYPSDLGLHAASYVAGSTGSQRTRIEAALANANHLSIFATGYGAGGAHLVHRQGGGRDGAIAIDPLDPKAHILTFRFPTDAF